MLGESWTMCLGYKKKVKQKRRKLIGQFQRELKKINKTGKDAEEISKWVFFKHPKMVYFFLDLTINQIN